MPEQRYNIVQVLKYFTLIHTNLQVPTGKELYANLLPSMFLKKNRTTRSTPQIPTMYRRNRYPQVFSCTRRTPYYTYKTYQTGKYQKQP